MIFIFWLSLTSFWLWKNYNIYFLTLTDIHFDCTKIIIFIFQLSPTSIITIQRLWYLSSDSHRRLFWLHKNYNIFLTSIMTTWRLWYLSSDSHRRPLILHKDFNIYFLTLTDVHFEHTKNYNIYFLTLTDVQYDCLEVGMFIFLTLTDVHIDVGGSQ